MKIDCSKCIFIDNTESQQQDNKRGHHCIKYNGMKLFHLDMHPKIYPCKQCRDDEYVNYIDYKEIRKRVNNDTR